MRSNVDFPEPLGPASAANSPVRTAMLTSDSTGSLPYEKETPSAASTTSDWVSGRAVGELSMILIMALGSTAVATRATMPV